MWDWACTQYTVQGANRAVYTTLLRHGYINIHGLQWDKKLLLGLSQLYDGIIYQLTDQEMVEYRSYDYYSTKRYDSTF